MVAGRKRQCWWQVQRKPKGIVLNNQQTLTKLPEVSHQIIRDAKVSTYKHMADEIGCTFDGFQADVKGYSILQFSRKDNGRSFTVHVVDDTASTFKVVRLTCKEYAVKKGA